MIWYANGGIIKTGKHGNAKYKTGNEQYMQATLYFHDRYIDEIYKLNISSGIKTE